MSNYSKGIETKRRLVNATYALLEQKPASDVTAREIATACELSPIVIYRHFGNLENLLVVASVRFLERHTEENGEYLRRMLDEADNGAVAYALYLDWWRMFTRYAFARPDVYYRLFWGDYRTEYEDAVQEYYDLFPMPAPTVHADRFYLLYFSGSMRERDFSMLRVLANEKVITMEDAEFLSETNSRIISSYLLEAENADAEQRSALHAACDRIISQNFERCRHVESEPHS